MRYLIIGLGIYGSNLALDLTDMGHEIVGADNRKQNIDAIKDRISTVYLIDATDEYALSLLPLNNVDLVIVAIGENFGASIKVVALLKKMKVKHIYARAIDALHESILRGFDIDRIITPEQRAARDLTDEMALGAKVQSLAVDDDNYVMKFSVPSHLIGTRYAEIDFQGEYGLKLIAVTREKPYTNIIGIRHCRPMLLSDEVDSETVEEGDTITCFGSRKGYYSLERHMKVI